PFRGARTSTWPKSYARETWVEKCGGRGHPGGGHGRQRPPSPAGYRHTPNRRVVLSIKKLILVSLVSFSPAGRLGGVSKYAELASHFKSQYLLGSVACLLLCLCYGEPAWAVAAALGVAINLAAVAPWHASGNVSTGNRAGGRRVSVILANVNFENTAHEAF